MAERQPSKLNVASSSLVSRSTIPTSDRLLGDADAEATLARLVEVVGPREIVVGWATVELDRAEVELALEPAQIASRERPPIEDDEILGARCRLTDAEDATRVVLLEPSTEGRLAAALARHGEGPIVAYLLADESAIERVRRRGILLTAAARGPFGLQRLVLGGRRAGPFHLIAGLAAPATEAEV